MRRLIICSAPRTGSTLLSHLLNHLGVTTAGHELFEPNVVMPKRLPELGLESVAQVEADLADYVRRIHEHWGREDRVLSLKLHWHQLSRWREHGLDLEEHFPGASYVVCTRRNRVAQAVSLLRATQTGSWTNQQPEQAEAEYDFDELLRRVRQVLREEQGWHAYLREAGIEPLRVAYEDLDEDRAATVLLVAEWLGTPLKPSSTRRRLRRLDRSGVGLRRQRGEINQEWEERFYADLVERALAPA